MKSGLEGRNNSWDVLVKMSPRFVSMKSGLEGRNNVWPTLYPGANPIVSMKSGLEGRNNLAGNAGLQHFGVLSQ